MVALLAGIFWLLAQAETNTSQGPKVLVVHDLKAKMINTSGSPVTVDSCRALSKLYEGGSLFNLAYVTLHNASKKPIEAIGLTLFPFTAFGDVAGDPKTSLLEVTLAPGESLGEDYKFNDGGKQPLMGGMTIIGGKLNEWPSVYEVRCEATRVRYQDGTVWKLF
jgi:hypothetical protein